MPFTLPPYLSRLAVPGICRVAGLAALLAAGPGLCAAADGAGKKAATVGPAAPRVQVPVPDIRANIMRRLREGPTRRPTPAPPATASDPATEAGPGPEEPAAAAPETRGDEPAPPPQEEPGAERPAGRAAEAKEKKKQQKAPAEWKPGRHYPVPEKTLTIRQLGDVDDLAEELEEARRRRENGPPE